MATHPTQPQWRVSASKIEPQFEDVRMPDDAAAPQDREWCEVVVDGRPRRIRFHDYDQVFAIPGLYERIFYEELECNSPLRVSDLLEDVVCDFGAGPDQLRVLDVGAGNGMVGEELRQRGVGKVVGIDIIPEARTAAERDRPGVYDNYYIEDLTDLPETVEEQLRKARLNCLTCVAALGFGDIPAAAFLKAFDILETPGWLAFNIKEEFLREQDNSGFARLVRQLAREEIMQIQSYRRYRHRLSVSGEPLYYVGMVAKKLRDVPHHLMDGMR